MMLITLIRMKLKESIKVNVFLKLKIYILMFYLRIFDRELVPT